MTIIYIIIAAICAILFTGSIFTVCKTGEKENICNYDYTEDKK